MRIRCRLLGALFCAAALFAGACGDSVGIEDITGRWDLTSVNGADVPGTVSLYIGSRGDTWTADVVYDYFTFLDGGVCEWSFQWDDNAETMDACEWAFTEETAVITIELGVLWTFSGPVSGARMTLEYVHEGSEPNVLVYVKQ
jgi:hypothetical protein